MQETLISIWADLESLKAAQRILEERKYVPDRALDSAIGTLRKTSATLEAREGPITPDMISEKLQDNLRLIEIPINQEYSQTVANFLNTCLKDEAMKAILTNYFF